MTVVVDGMRLVRASERLSSLMDQLTVAMSTATKVIEIAPELAPELAALQNGLLEVAEHLRSAMTVLNAKAELL